VVIDALAKRLEDLFARASRPFASLVRLLTCPRAFRAVVAHWEHQGRVEDFERQERFAVEVVADLGVPEARKAKHRVDRRRDNRMGLPSASRRLAA